MVVPSMAAEVRVNWPPVAVRDLSDRLFTVLRRVRFFEEIPDRCRWPAFAGVVDSVLWAHVNIVLDDVLTARWKLGRDESERIRRSSIVRETIHFE